MISKVSIYDNKYYYKKREYNKNNLSSLIERLTKKVKITLYSEDIFIKKYEYFGNKIENHIEEKINCDFSDKNNILFHYEADKENKIIYLYSLRNDNFKKIYDNADNLSIEPIQFKVKNYIVKKLRKNKEILVFYNINDLNTVLYIKNNLIIDLIMSKNFNEIENYINERKKENNILVVDKNTEKIKDFKNIEINHFIDLGVKKHE